MPKTILIIMALAAFLAVHAMFASAAGDTAKPTTQADKTATAVFAGGCFWCTESDFEKVPGVLAVVSGYTGGRQSDPTYREVSSGGTGHVEAVRVVYDPAKVSYQQLLAWFWRRVDPTDDGGQFVDRGSQYRSAIFYTDEQQHRLAEASKQALAASGRFDKPIATMILPLEKFYPAEDYHQDYYETNPLRYRIYRNGSGRDRFLTGVWGDAKESLRQALASAPGPDQAAKAPAAGPLYAKPDDSVLRKKLSPRQYEVTQQNGTEPPFRNDYWNNHEAGIYVDVVTGEPLFASIDKFDSGTGWPSFTKPLDPAYVVEVIDRSHGMVRTEVRSKYGDSHLGHIFNDGPPPTRIRYCINSAALRFVPKADMEKLGYGKYLGIF